MRICIAERTWDRTAVTLETDWWRAFNFFLGRACYQGRRDEQSDLVYEHACEVLEPFFSNAQRDINYESQKGENWKEISTQLCEKIGKGKVGNARDVKMMISALEFYRYSPQQEHCCLFGREDKGRTTPAAL